MVKKVTMYQKYLKLPSFHARGRAKRYYVTDSATFRQAGEGACPDLTHKPLSSVSNLVRQKTKSRGEEIEGIRTNLSGIGYHGEVPSSVCSHPVR